MGPILFNIFLSDLLLVVKDVKFASYADDNKMKGNTDKCNLIMSTNNTPELKVGDSLIKTSTCKKLLSVHIDCKLTFDNHMANSCNKANNKLRALARATPYMTLKKESF